MMLLFIIICLVILAIGYRFYGAYLSRRLELDDSRPTPAVEMNDGVDYVPAGKSMLLGQHFSAISAAGPIVGPILAGIWFGWLPAVLWILLGTIFIGGTHDFATLVASVRHKAASIGELARQYMSRTSQILYLIFVWFALVYVIIAFTDITAQTFKTMSANEALGPGVAVSSFLYLFLGVALGLALYKLKIKLWQATAVALPLLMLMIWWGTSLPSSMTQALMAIPLKSWEVILLVYCFIASLLPMWLLLQPRGYLGGWFLYLTIATALFGALFGGFSIQYPAFNTEGLMSIFNGKPLLPIVFITVACGACSGFHGIVSAGTTSKQIAKESDTRPVAYGSMILEAVVAILALVTLMILPKGDPLLKSDPNFIFAKGLSGYLGSAGVSTNLALSFALLAFSTFVYDTLDVCTRLARYILQELFGWKSMAGAFFATLITLSLPLFFLMVTREKGYLAAWPIFGISNQLLASLTLLAVSVWLIRTGKKALFAIIPMVFMLAVALWALILQIKPFIILLISARGASGMKLDVMISGICGVILLILSLWLVVESCRVIVAAHRDGRRMA
jgi:carbon starvation protein